MMFVVGVVVVDVVVVVVAVVVVVVVDVDVDVVVVVVAAVGVDCWAIGADLNSIWGRFRGRFRVELNSMLERFGAIWWTI